MLKTLSTLAIGRSYWLLLFIWGSALETTALYYQYALDEWPCVLCIHVRILVMGVILLSLLGTVFKLPRRAISVFHGLNSLLLAWLLERSWHLLGVERGFIFGSCNMESGLPGWFALDKWFPLIFEVQASCGYTPELLFGVTMAEALLVMSGALLLLSLLMLVLSFRRESRSG